MIDYKALAKRLEMHAECHANIEPHDDEQRQWAADLRTVVSLLRGMADAAPIYAYEWDTYNGGVHRSFRSAPWNGRYPDRVLVLYTHPAPQPQPTEATLKLRLHFDDDEDGPLEIVAHGSKRDMAFLETRIGYWQRLDDRFGKGGPTEAGFTLDQLADACMAAEIPDSKYESLCIALAEERKAAPQPQPEPIDPHMIVAEDRFPDEPEPTEAQQSERMTYSHAHWSKCSFDELVNGLVANAGVFYRDTRDAFRSDVIDALHRAQEIAMQGREPTEAQIEQHPDDAAVDRFAAAMKAKLAEKRAEGRGGWDDPEQCSTTYLATLLRGHVAKGDPLDVGNFAMMLWNRGGATNEAIDVGIPDLRPTEAQIEAAAKWLDHHLPPEIPACSNRTALAVGVLRAALAAEQPEPTEDDDTDRTIEEIADFFNEHGAEANEPTDAQIEAAADVTHDDFDALAVVDSYTRAAPEFDANVLRDFLSRYPQHAKKLLFYAARQLNSTPATPEEVEREEISNEELLRMQSKVLKLLGKARLAATHFCKDCGALWRQCDDYSFSLHLSTRACPRCELESNATQLISLRNERERLRAVAEAHGSALQRAGTAAGLSAGADLHKELVPAIESLQVEPLRRWVGDADGEQA